MTQRAARVNRRDPWQDTFPLWNDMPEEDDQPVDLEAGWDEDARAAVARRAAIGQLYGPIAP